jgi:hypothetical protein
MARRIKADGQPNVAKLAAEGLSIRKCIASNDSYGEDGGTPEPVAKPTDGGGLASMPMRKGGGY